MTPRTLDRCPADLTVDAALARVRSGVLRRIQPMVDALLADGSTDAALRLIERAEQKDARK